MTYYLIRVGEGSKYAPEALKDGFVAVGWNEVGDLSKFGDAKAIRKALEDGYDFSPAKVAASAGQIYRFGLEMQPGDRAVMPLGEGEYAVGEMGDYYYEGEPAGGCPYKHRRHVTWLERHISKDDMSANLSYALGGLLTLYSLDRYSTELGHLISGEPHTPAEKPERVRDIVLASLMELDGREFEEFVRHLLELVGFTAEATQYVGDKGIDVNGVLDAEGLASITLRVQVKRVRGSIGNREVLALRGALSQGEQGCLITLSSFTTQAVQEADASGKVPIRLIDGDDLACLVLRHFDELDEQYHRQFPIKRRKDFNIEDQFEAIFEQAEGLPATSPRSSKKVVDWDTIVCPAKEDGFKRAFLGQKAWWAVRLNQSTIDHIKYIAIYQVAPISKITHYGEVDRIEPFENTGKFKLYLKGDPVKLENPIGQESGKPFILQGSRYTKFEQLLKATTLRQAFG